MPYVIHCTDREDGAALRRKLRAEHIEYMIEHLSVQLFGGPLLDERGNTVGSLMVTSHANRDEVDAFLRDEPYAKNDLFRDVRIHALRQMMPETEPGQIEGELRREQERRREA